MKVLVTAGNTMTPIDRVRVITNIFTGRTGTHIARYFAEHGHAVTLLTSHPELADTMPRLSQDNSRLQLHAYKTFGELHALMQSQIVSRTYDALIHAAAVSDYESAGVFEPAAGTRFDLDSKSWQGPAGELPRLEERTAGKIKSAAGELWLRLVRTAKLIDLVRTEWDFGGVVVKFKLEVGVAVSRLLEIAEQSRLHSGADLMVANALEEVQDWAFIGPQTGGYEAVSRAELPARLCRIVEALARERGHG